MTKFKDICYILGETENYFFLINENIKVSKLGSYTTLLDLSNYLNPKEYYEVEFWINDKIYHIDDKINLFDLGFNPNLNIIKITRREVILNNSTELNCDRLHGDRITVIKRTIRYNLYNIKKVNYVWDCYIENLEKINQDLNESFNFRKSNADNKFEIEAVDQVSNEIIELEEELLEKVRKKLKKMK